MDAEYIEKIKSITPVMNEKLANGLATSEMDLLMYYLDDFFRSLNFPEEVVFKNICQCDPLTQFLQTVQRRNGKMSIEMSKYSTYMSKLTFEINGTPEEVYLQLIYCEDGGKFIIKDNMFTIRPVLLDEVFSYSGGFIFVKFNRARLKITRRTHYYLENGTRKAGYYAWAWVHHEARARLNRMSSNAKIHYSTLAVYIFAEYGVVEAFRIHAGVDVIIGDSSVVNREALGNDYVIYGSLGKVPNDWDNSAYVANPYKLAIKKTDVNVVSDAFVCAFIYHIDRFHMEIDTEDNFESYTWCYILSRIIIPENTHLSLALNMIDVHRQSLKEYVDTMAISTFKKMGIRLTSIYEVFTHIITLLANPSLAQEHDPADVGGKKFDILSYACSEIINSANMVMYALLNTKKKNGTVSIDDFRSVLRTKKFRSSMMLNLGKTSAHPQVDIFASTPICKLFSTMEIVPQLVASKRNQGKRKNNLSDPSLHASASLAHVCSITNTPKNDPTGRRRSSPYVQLDEDLKPIPYRNPTVLRKTQEMLTLRINNPYLDDDPLKEEDKDV